MNCKHTRQTTISVALVRSFKQIRLNFPILCRSVQTFQFYADPFKLSNFNADPFKSVVLNLFWTMDHLLKKNPMDHFATTGGPPGWKVKTSNFIQIRLTFQFCADPSKLANIIEIR